MIVCKDIIIVYKILKNHSVSAGFLGVFPHTVWIRLGNKGMSYMTFIQQKSCATGYVFFMAAFASVVHTPQGLKKQPQREKPTTTSFSFATPFNVNKWGLDQ